MRESALSVISGCSKCFGGKINTAHCAEAPYLADVATLLWREPGTADNVVKDGTELAGR